MTRLKQHPAVEVALGVQKRYGQDGAGLFGAGIAYYGFFSLFPLLLVGLAAAGFVFAADPTLRQEVAARLTEAVPGLAPLVAENLEAVADARAGIGLLGLAGLLWSGTAIVNASAYALARVFDVPPRTGLLKRPLWSLAWTTGLGLLALGAVALGAAAGAVRLDGAAGVLVPMAGFAVAFGMDFLLFLVAYRVLVPPGGPSIGKLWPGALLVAVFWAVLKFGGGWYGARTVAGATEVYGTFASVIGVLVLLFLVSRLFLYGAELNAVLLERGRQQRRQPGQQEPDRDREEVRTVNSSRRADLKEQSTPELVGSIASDMTELVRKEVQLARQETVEALTARVKGAAALGAAGVVGLLCLVFLALGAAAALDTVMTPWASRLIVAAGLAVGAVGALGVAVTKMRRPPLMPEQTVETVKEDVEWARTQLRR